MDTFEHAVIVRSVDGRGVTPVGTIPHPTGQILGQLGDIVGYLDQLKDEGWRLTAVHTAASGEERYWLQRPAR